MVQLLKSKLTTKNIRITINNPKIYTEAQKAQTAKAILSRKIMKQTQHMPVIPASEG